MNNRRDFITKLAYGTFGVTVMPNLVHADVTSTLASPKRTAKYFVNIFLDGGCSHTDSWDIKTNEESRSKFAAINTKVDAIKLSEHLSGLAQHTDKMALFRGMSIQTGDHENAKYTNRTSFKKIGTIMHPTLGAWANFVHEGKPSSIPKSILIGSQAQHPGSGWLGSKYAPLPIVDPLRGISNGVVKNPDEFSRRLHILDELNRETNKNPNASLQAYSDFYRQTVKLLDSKDLEVFDINKEAPSAKEKFGNNRFGQGMLLIKRLFEKSDVRYCEIILGGWDNHTNIYNIMDGNLNTLDQGLSALISELSTLGIMQDTLISINTDFGRTPRYNSNTGKSPLNVSAGKDHFPKAYSQVMIGCGVKGGTVYGKTNEFGDEVIDQQTSVQDFNATVATILGMDVEKTFISPEQRPFKIADKGKVIREVLG